MKKWIVTLFIVFMLFVFDSVLFKDSIYNIYNRYINKYGYRIISNPDSLNTNNYTKKDYSSYVSSTDSLTAHNEQELKNIYYSAVNSGFDRLTFYCDNNYSKCGNDINYLNNAENNFSYVNQLVNVYNSYSSIESTYSSNLRVDINIIKKYSKEEETKINKRIDELIDILEINNYTDVKDKIKVFHDYIAETSKYDEEMAENLQSDYNSDKAIGPLFEGKAICSGYSDVMSIFLDKLGLENIRVATDEHVWNAVLLNGTWYHIDLTWDDPIVTSGEDIIQYDYFMITTSELENKNDKDHIYNKEVYDFL